MGIVVAVSLITAINIATTFAVLHYSNFTPTYARTLQQPVSDYHDLVAQTSATKATTEQHIEPTIETEDSKPEVTTSTSNTKQLTKRYLYYVVAHFPATVHQNQHYYDVQSTYEESNYANTNTNVSVHNEMTVHKATGIAPIVIKANVENTSTTNNEAAAHGEASN